MTEQRRKAVERLQKIGHYQRIGSKGGAQTKRRMLAKDPDYFEAIGYRGGKALLKERGREYFSTIGKIGKREESL